MVGVHVIAREIQSMKPMGFQVAKSIVLLARSPEGTWKKIGGRGYKRPMCQAEAKRIVDAAEARIALVDDDELCLQDPQLYQQERREK